MCMSSLDIWEYLLMIVRLEWDIIRIFWDIQKIHRVRRYFCMRGSANLREG
jgi:hypothetical protein